jgi:hypothetical protein
LKIASSAGSKIGNYFLSPKVFGSVIDLITIFGRNVPRKPHLAGGVKGHNMSETSFSGSPALSARSFKKLW